MCTCVRLVEWIIEKIKREYAFLEVLYTLSLHMNLRTGSSHSWLDEVISVYRLIRWNKERPYFHRCAR